MKFDEGVRETWNVEYIPVDKSTAGRLGKQLYETAGGDAEKAKWMADQLLAEIERVITSLATRSSEQVGPTRFGGKPYKEPRSSNFDKYA